MKTPKTILLGTGYHVPEKVLTNFDLEKMVDTSDEWIRTRTGIKERRIASPELTTSQLCTFAAQKALKDAGLQPEDIDVILLGTITGDALFPSTACYVQEKLGAVNAAAMDVQAACAGFVYISTLADALISSGKAKHVLAIGGELLSRIVDWTDRNTCVLFGDGAGAAVWSRAPGDSTRGVIDTYLKSDGRLTELLCSYGGGTNTPLAQIVAENRQFITMKGQEVFKAAVNSMSEAVELVLARNNLTGDDIDVLIPHQANIRIMNAVVKKTKIAEEKVYVNVDRFGNTSAASIPIALAEARETGFIKPGQLVLHVSFGGGFTWGALLLRE
ncbi:MAG: ketoacyl-ACP synthase III [Deferribacteres bacterium]|nr:ketoacyl-ACP synthase III [candidate division KSB1 bacterium]MCB9500566.1 ketoacyl-ACP synthase III [Deferribacteres bacterium]